MILTGQGQTHREAARGTCERARIEKTLEQTTQQLRDGHSNAGRVLDYLENPYELYERAGLHQKTKLNRLIFTNLTIDVTDEGGVHVIRDELTDPFATVV